MSELDSLQAFSAYLGAEQQQPATVTRAPAPAAAAAFTAGIPPEVILSLVTGRRYYIDGEPLTRAVEFLSKGKHKTAHDFVQDRALREALRSRVAVFQHLQPPSLSVQPGGADLKWVWERMNDSEVKQLHEDIGGDASKLLNRSAEIGLRMFIDDLRQGFGPEIKLSPLI